MDQFLGTSLLVFIGLTVVLFGGAAFMAGQAIAVTWRPAWQTVPYGLLLGAADRFLTFALFEGQLLSLRGYVVHSIILIGFAALGFRVTKVQQIVAQYPWLYERSGLLSWRERAETPQDGAPPLQP